MPKPLESPAVFFGRKLSLECRATEAFWAKRTIWQPWVVLCGGLALTLARLPAIDSALPGARARSSKSCRLAWRPFRSRLPLSSSPNSETLCPVEQA